MSKLEARGLGPSTAKKFLPGVAQWVHAGRTAGVTIAFEPYRFDRKISGGIMKRLFAAAAAVAAMAVCGAASAQSNSDILQRLEALEKSNTDLKKENAALRDRVRHIESGKQTASAALTAPSASGSSATRPTSGYAAASMAPVYKAMPMAAPAGFSWTGFYIGAHGGFAWARATGPDLHIDQHGGFGGIQAGVNYQFWDHWVLGIEHDASFGNIKGSTGLSCGNPNECGTKGTVAVTIDAFGSFRERVGYAWDRMLIYQTAGVAWAHAKPHIVVTSCSDGDNNNCTPGAFDDRRLMTGLAAAGAADRRAPVPAMAAA